MGKYDTKEKIKDGIAVAMMAGMSYVLVVLAFSL